MSAIAIVIACVAGGLGATLRYLADTRISSRVGTGFPWGTFVINVSGSLLLGLVTSLAAEMIVDAQVRMAVGTGLLGGYTTFSTASVQTLDLLRAGRRVRAAVFAVGMLFASLCGAAIGLFLGSLVR